MYYSKNGGNTINIPRNYSGNTFRVIDETERDRIPKKEHTTDFANDEDNDQNENFRSKNDAFAKNSEPVCEISEPKHNVSPSISALFSGISVEDLLLLGLIFVIHQENPNDSTLLLLLILLLAK